MKISEKLKTGLTNAEKIECYKNAIHEIASGNYRGICAALVNQFEFTISDEKLNTGEILTELFPEFARQRPFNCSWVAYWYQTQEERIQVLNELIAELS